MTTLPAQPKAPPLLALPSLPLPAPAKADRAPRAQQPRAEFAQKLNERRNAPSEEANDAGPTQAATEPRDPATDRAERPEKSPDDRRTAPRPDKNTGRAEVTTAETPDESSEVRTSCDQDVDEAAHEKPESESTAADPGEIPAQSAAVLRPPQVTPLVDGSRIPQDAGDQPADFEPAETGAAAADAPSVADADRSRPAKKARSAGGPDRASGVTKEGTVRRGTGVTGPAEHAAEAGAERANKVGEAGSAQDADVAAATKIDRPLTIRQLNELLLKIDPKVASSGLLGLATGSTEGVGSRERVSFAASHPQPFSVAGEPAPVVGSASPASPMHTVQAPPAAAEERPAVREDRAAVERGANQLGSKPQEVARAAGAVRAEVVVEKNTTTPPPLPAPKPTSEARVSIAPVVGTIGVSRVTGRTRAAAEKAAVNPPTAEHALTAQVQRGLAAAIAQGGGQVTLRMQPAALGQLRVRLEMRADVVKLRFEVGSAAARSLLDEQLPGLGRMLEDQGLRVAHASVGTDPTLAGREPHRPHDAAGQQAAMDGGGHWTGGERGAEDGAGGHGAWEHASGPRTPEETGSSPRSGGVFIEGEGGVLDPVTARLNALA